MIESGTEVGLAFSAVEFSIYSPYSKKPLPDFLPKRLESTNFFLQLRRCKTRMPLITFPDLTSHHIIHIQTNQIHQLKRSHPESTAVTHNSITACSIGPVFFGNLERLAIKRTSNTIDDKSWTGTYVNRTFTPLFGQLENSICNR